MIKRDTNLYVKLVLFIFLIVLLVILFSEAGKVSELQVDTGHTTVKSMPLLFPELNNYQPYDKEQMEDLLAKVNLINSALELMDTSCYTDEAINAMITEQERLTSLEHSLKADLEHYAAMEEEHYYATNVWSYFRQRGFSDEITCAIIGNMMVETSGGTLGLKPNIYSPSGNYYGLCQWSQKYYPGTKDLPFEYQLDYLLGSMPWEINTFGTNYKEGFTYDDFFMMTDVEEAALAFAQAYERCGPASYKMRQEAAVKAYEYFS